MFKQVDVKPLRVLWRPASSMMQVSVAWWIEVPSAKMRSDDQVTHLKLPSTDYQCSAGVCPQCPALKCAEWLGNPGEVLLATFHPGGQESTASIPRF